MSTEHSRPETPIEHAAYAEHKGNGHDHDQPKAAASSVAVALIAIGECTTLFHDERGDAYALTKDEVQRTLRVRGREFRRWLCRRFYDATKRAANGEAIAAALNVLEAQACFSGKRIALENRFAFDGSVIWIDLCDEKWRAIKVTKDKWEIIDKPPALFRRYSHQQPLPEPESGGKLDDLFKFLNVALTDKRLITGWAPTIMIPGIPRPAVCFTGPQGSAKTTAARKLRSLVDPSAVESLDLGRCPNELAQALDHHAVPFFDNLTKIQPWQSDLLCRAITGGGFSKRELYSDAEDIIFAFKRPLLLTGISVPAAAPDLLDRTILIEFGHIEESKRKSEQEVWRTFNEARPRLFGALLDALSGAMRVFPEIALKRLPRMADFSHWGAAVAEACGTGQRTFIRAMFDNVKRQTDEIIESNPFALAIRDFMKDRLDEWEGTATELLAMLEKLSRSPKSSGWPRNERSVGHELNNLQAPLANIGIQIKRKRTGRARLIFLKSIEQTARIRGELRK